MTEVVQIRIGRQGTVGLVGFREALAEAAETMKGASDEKIRQALLSRLSRRNYISDNVADLYKEAFLREYKKFVGEPYADETAGGIEIKILGPGCPRCDGLEQDVMAVLAETGIEAALEHVREAAEIGRYGVMGAPALVINNEVKAVGTVPPRVKIRDWLVQAAGL